MEDEAARADMAAHEFGRDFLREHLADERRKANLLGEVREAIFGAQDGLVSTVAVVSAVAGASQDRFTVLIAGIAAGLAGVFSMAAGGSPMQGALVMGAAFGLGAVVPIIPHLLLPIGPSVVVAVVATLAVLFGIGVVKSRWTHRGWLSSGLEILVIGAIAGVVGYFFGSILPVLLGV